MDDHSLLSEETISNKIYFIRGQKILLDFDLAHLYGVETRRLNEQVKRNILRFPSDFMFQLTENELENLMSQIATSSWGELENYPLLLLSTAF
ncbi:ORF6N domain-containing protein [Flavobacterium sp. FlaQc-57]|uniref:ORF6N domain-containing protein n=1 Tax=Flavobacterium sp. FlaQc-57 TaxID=3374186 RepID=UPI0037572CC6